jgi:hypothetical protein
MTKVRDRAPVQAPPRPAEHHPHRLEATVIGVSLVLLFIAAVLWSGADRRIPIGWSEYEGGREGLAIGYPARYEVVETSEGVTFEPPGEGTKLSIARLDFQEMTVERLVRLEAYGTVDLGATDTRIEQRAPVDGHVSAAIREVAWGGDDVTLRVFVQSNRQVILVFTAQASQPSFDEALIDRWLSTATIG